MTASASAHVPKVQLPCRLGFAIIASFLNATILVVRRSVSMRPSCLHCADTERPEKSHQLFHNNPDVVLRAGCITRGLNRKSDGFSCFCTDGKFCRSRLRNRCAQRYDIFSAKIQSGCVHKLRIPIPELTASLYGQDHDNGNAERPPLWRGVYRDRLNLVRLTQPLERRNDFWRCELWSTLPETARP